MTLLDRYLMRTVFAYSAMVLSVFLVLSGLFLFIGQQDDIGVGNYGAADALLFSLLNLPQQAFETLPIAVLLGSMLGLGALARGSELVVVRAAGVSVARVSVSVLLAGFVLMIFAALLGEVVAPPLQKLARQQKVFSKFADVSFAGSGSAWVKDGPTMISVQEQTGEDIFSGVYVFRFSDPQKLESVARATRAVAAGGHNEWRLDDFAVTEFKADRVDARRQPSELLATRIDPGFLGLAVSEPRQMRSLGLVRLIQHLRQNGLETGSYEFALWSRIARTCAVVIVALVAVPFSFGPLRSSGAGARMLIGVLIGITFFLMQRMLESGTILFNLDPMLLAWIPTATLAAVTLLLLARTR